MSTLRSPDLFTRAVHAGAATGNSASGRPLCPPIAQTVTFARGGIDDAGGFSYSRVSNPTVDALEGALGDLEDAEPAVCFDSGLAAETTLFLALLGGGGHVIVSDVVYGGTTRLLERVLGPFGVTSTAVDCGDLAALGAAIRPETRLLFVETPGNPTLKLTDVAAVAAIARERGVPLGVDNTFLTPAILRPLEIGADFSLYSTTKWIEGHNGALGGAIVTRDVSLLERLRFLRKCLGTIQSPLGAWLTARGVKTLPLRVERASRSAAIVAAGLERTPGVARVLHPSLPSFPQRVLARRMHGDLHGGVLAFEVEGGLARAKRLVASLELCTLAENLGATETLVTHSATMTHADVPRERRLAAGIGDGLVRVSVGLEDPAAVLADLVRAVEKSRDAANVGEAACA